MKNETYTVKADFRLQRIFHALLFVAAIGVAEYFFSFNHLLSRVIESIFVALSLVMLFLYLRGSPKDIYLEYRNNVVSIYWPKIIKSGSISFSDEDVVEIVVRNPKPGFRH